ncbi:MAG TPA: GNAT family N-acetyltransferase [Fimbriimonadaceae bacterium]|nr:GNAT family N-acetyltransferase [Fimbriimonadaceae bacterium]
MTTTRVLDGPTANLVETYFRLAQATPGTCAWQRGNLSGCTGPFAHAICNFAVASEIGEADLRELARIIDAREAFHTYLLPGASGPVAERRLAEIGLRPTYRLVQMAAAPVHEFPGLHPVEATTHAARLALAKFMVGQFFFAQPKQFREGIARATARAGGLELYAVGYQGAVVGSLMTCREGSTLGVYNLCVAPDFRGQGWGRSMLEWVRCMAGAEGRTVTLQCEPRLSDWYRRAGFNETGEISAFSRAVAGTFDTM